MSEETLHNIIEKSVADYGFRLAVMWGPDDVIARAGLSEADGETLRSIIVPELKQLPDPVEPNDQPAVNERLLGLLPGRTS